MGLVARAADADDNEGVCRYVYEQAQCAAGVRGRTKEGKGDDDAGSPGVYRVPRGARVELA